MTNEQIVALYEAEDGMSIDELSEAFQLPTAQIKMTLASESLLYRERVKQATKQGDTISEMFSNDETEQAKQIVVSLMRGSEDDNVRFRAAKLVLDEKKGLREPQKALRNVNFNVNLIQQIAYQAEAAKKRAIESEIVIDEKYRHLKELAV